MVIQIELCMKVPKERIYIEFQKSERHLLGMEWENFRQIDQG